MSNSSTTWLWLLATALSVLMAALAFGFHLYQRRRFAAAMDDASDVADLAARKSALMADVDILRSWIGEQQQNLLKLQGEREEQERVRAELTHLQQSLAEGKETRQTLAEQTTELENRRATLTQTLDDLRHQLNEVESKKLEEATARVTALNTKIQVLDSEISAREERLDQLRKESADLTETLEEMRGAKEALTLARSLDSLRLEVAEAKTTAARVVELKAEQTALVTRNQFLENEIDDRKSAISPLKQTISRMKTWLEQIQPKLAAESTKLDSLRDEVSGLEARKASLTLEVERWKAELAHLTAPEGESSIFEAGPAGLSPGEFALTSCDPDEGDLLRQLKQTLQREGHYFPSRVIDAFHTALKCQSINPLTILAGVAGTGKTLLPLRYAELMGLYSLVVPAQPRWETLQSMFGVYDHREKRYKASDLSRALVRLDPYNYPELDRGNVSLRDRMLLILIDEMNLAQPEALSELLSRLELRRLVETPDKAAKRAQAELEIDTGPGGRRLRVWVPDNVLLVGTINDDKIVRPLFDKMMEHANVMRFGRPDDQALIRPIRYGAGAQESFLPAEAWRGWLKGPDGGWYMDEVKSWSIALNQSLDRIGRPFGFRAQQALALYVANYPEVGSGDRHRLAFADQLEQKILPRLRGLEVRDPSVSSVLQQFGALIQRLGDKPLETTFSQAREASGKVGRFLWPGVTRRLDEGE
ncbi:MAG: AAA family ATPase [Candidatus Adiutrix sp.]|jgi:predicted nuclease with TOPRIM domain|nr:AAA family ATPase [Candidatus Adiutrix sp.]